jgi:hypothetical protein
MQPGFLRFASLLLVAVSIMALPHTAPAQDNVWNASKKAAAKLNKGKKGIKKWNEHLQNWSMDESYNHQFALGGKLNSNGWSGGAYYLKKTGKTKLAVGSLTFSEIKHDKQIKQQRDNVFYPQFGTATPYVFGKINNLYTLQIGYGRQMLLLPGVIDGNLSVSFRYGGGFSLALLKPYYLRLVYVDYNNPTVPPVLKEEKYSDANAEMFLTPNNTIGASKWSKGLNEMKSIPGGFIEAEALIEPMKNKFLIETITIGANGAYYSKSLPIMAELKVHPWQASVFVGLSLGAKWR